MKYKNQYDIKECGLLVLQTIYSYFYKKDININQLKSSALIGEQGINVAGLSKIAKNINLNLESYECSFEYLTSLNFTDPLISIINEQGLNHYILILKITKNKIFFYDPLFGKRTLSLEKFKDIFLNVIIKVEKEFVTKIEKSKKYFTFFNFDQLSPWIILFNIVALILTFIQSFYIKIIFDNVFSSKDNNLLLIVLLIFLWIILTKLIFVFIKDYLIKKLEQKKSYQLYLKFRSKLSQMNIRSIKKNENIDYMRRIGLIESFSNFNVSFSFFVLSEIFNLIITSILLFWIDRNLFIYAILIGLSSLLISYLFNNKINKHYPKILKSNFDFNKSNINFVFSLNQIKNTKSLKFEENSYKTNLSNYYYENYQFFKINFLKNIMLSIIENVVPIILIYFISLQVIKNTISQGSLLMFLSVYSFFITPFYSFSNILNNLPIQRQNLELLNYVFSQKSKDLNETELIKINKIQKIKLKNIDLFFEEGKFVLNNFNFNFDQDFQIKGANGTGKSCLLSIISFQSLQNNGDIFINDKDIKSLDISLLQDKIIYINPHDYLSNYKIIDYLILQNKQNFDCLQKNLENYELINILQELKIDFNALLINNGQNLSSGQRSIIFLLKLFTQKYDFILLDEAFENLNNEIFLKIKKLILNFQDDAIFIEISHNNNFLKNNKELIL